MNPPPDFLSIDGMDIRTRTPIKIFSIPPPLTTTPPNQETTTPLLTPPKTKTILAPKPKLPIKQGIAMTTTVTINAHCDPATTEVRIIRGPRVPSRHENRTEEFILDGETRELVVHDDLYISVDEVPKLELSARESSE